MDFAGQYMQAARRKVAVPEVEDFRPSPPRRAETFAAPSPGVNVRHVTPFSDEETPRRSSASSARKESRKSVDTPSRRDKSSKDRRSPPAQVRDPYIVEPPDPPVAPRKPTLQSHSSAPPNLSIPIREKPSRSRTQEYPRQEAAPSLPRAQTFQAGERSRERSGGSRLKKSVEYSSDSSDSDSPIRPTQRRSYSPQRRGTETRYVVESGHINHRSTLHHIDDEQVYTRDRSESPRGGRHSRERPPMPRAPSSHERPRAVPVRPGSQTYYTPDPPPIIREARPSMTSREPSYRGSSRGAPGAYFQEVKYAPKYGAENVIYSAQPADIYQKRSDQNRDPYYASYQRSGRGEGAVAY
ncbi:hypothetical protein G7Y89_g5020 [Cudoniella acicularis]|uniref:Uncharacterized protein n=1 Tax=Cudoniella acicularis TaxID=354080 RepID=A0A8H4RQH2_9HELO|nr:hypothetical protein G7Y89_g5020 [Cudoniella acicularis]